jgi:hypothetical protein
MDTKFVVLSLLRKAAEAGATGAVTHAVRLDRAFDGQPGEGYLLCFGDTLCLAERPLGEPDYRCFTAPRSAVRIGTPEPGSLLSHVRIDFNGMPLTCSWSWAENEDAADLFALLPGMESGGDASMPEAAADSPGVLFVAGLMFGAEFNGELPPEQEKWIRNLAAPNALKPGMALYQRHDLAAYAALVKAKFSEEQLVSLLANQLEVIMADGDLRPCERDGMREFVRLIGFPEPRYREMLEVILQKNCHAVLFPA